MTGPSPLSAIWRIALTASLALCAGAQSPPQLWGDDDPQAQTEFPKSTAICRRVRNAVPPAADRPDAAARRALKGCESVDLYYGLGGRKKDVVKARHCALIQTETSGVEDGPNGFGVLSMIYANGEGVSPNLDIALRMACEEGFTASDIDRRILALDARRTKAGKLDRFDYCDDVMSDFAIGWCLGIESDLEQQVRRKTLARYAQGWTPAQRTALDAVLKTETAYTDAIMRDETDMGGTIRFIRTWEAEAEVRDFNSQLLQALIDNGGPTGDAATLVRDDAALNSAWRRLARVELDGLDSVSHAGITRTQRAWLKHRDAWTAFVRLRWPQRADAVTAYLTRERTRRLVCLAEGEGNTDGCR